MNAVQMAEKALAEARDAQAKLDAAAAASAPVEITGDELTAVLSGYVASATAEKGRPAYTNVLKSPELRLKDQEKVDFLINEIKVILKRYDLKVYRVGGEVVFPFSSVAQRAKMMGTVISSKSFKKAKGHTVVVSSGGALYYLNVNGLEHAPAIGTEIPFRFRVNGPGSLALWKSSGDGLASDAGYSHASIKYFTSDTEDISVNAEDFPKPPPSKPTGGKKGVATL